MKACWQEWLNASRHVWKEHIGILYFQQPTTRTLLDHTLVRPLNLLLHPSVHLLVKSSFSKNSAKSVWQEPPASTTDGGPPPPPPTRWRLIALACLQPESPSPLTFPHSSFHPLTPTLLPGYKLPLAHAIFSVEPNSLSDCKIPLLRSPQLWRQSSSPNKVFLITLEQGSLKIFFLNTSKLSWKNRELNI